MKRAILGLLLLAVILALSRGSLKLAPDSWCYELPGAFTLKVSRTVEGATAVVLLGEERE